MRLMLLLLGFTMVVSYAYSSEIAFYVGEPNVDGWYTRAQMLKDVETIKNLSGKLFQNIAEFDDDELNDFAKWAEARTNDKKLDIIWLKRERVGSASSCVHGNY